MAVLCIIEGKLKCRFRGAGSRCNPVIHVGRRNTKHAQFSIYWQDLRTCICKMLHDCVIKFLVSPVGLWYPFSNIVRNRTDKDFAIRNLHRIRAYSVAAAMRRLAVFDWIFPSMPGAGYNAPMQRSLAQRPALMHTYIGYRVELAVDMEKRDLYFSALSHYGKCPWSAFSKFVGRTDVLEIVFWHFTSYSWMLVSGKRLHLEPVPWNLHVFLQQFQHGFQHPRRAADVKYCILEFIPCQVPI